jgi:CubicO group peptidase (beta-lactamase class C family)
MIKNNQGKQSGSTSPIAILALACTGFSLPSIAGDQATDLKAFTTLLDKQIPQLLEDFMVPGSGVAIIKNGQVVFKKGYGFADVAKQKPVNLDTGFNIGSISKTVAAWGVMRLVEQGKISLDAPVEQYIKRWKLPKTEFDNSAVTVRRLLSHTAGLSLHGYPGWGEKDTQPSIEASLSGENNGPGDVKLIMKPGTKWQYSGGGYTICQLLIEEVSGQKFSDYMREHVLRPLGMKNSDYQMTPAILAHSAVAYDGLAQVTPNPLFTAKAAAGLHTTIEDFSQFALANLTSSTQQKPGRDVLKPKTIKQMLAPAPASKGKWGLGYNIKSLANGQTTVGHGGANRGWHAVFNVVPQTNDGLVITTNSSNGYSVYQVIICQWQQWTTGIKAEDNCVSKKSIALTLGKTIKFGTLDAAIKQYHQLKKSHATEYKFTEDQLNSLGYSLVNQRDLNGAITIFALNVAEYPDQANPYDSLGEAYMMLGNTALARKNYQHVLKLDPKNNNALQMLEKLAKMK